METTHPTHTPDLAAKCAAAAAAAAYQTREALDRREHAADERKDRAATDTRPLTTRELLASLRDDRGRYEAEDLIKLAADAAGLSMRGKMYSPDDRRDCAAEIIGHVMARTDGMLPYVDDPRSDLSALRGLAQNFRRGLDRRRAADAKADAASKALKSSSWTDAAARILDELEMSADRAEDAAAVCAAAADLACRRLRMPRGGAVWSIFYQWARGESGAKCARECGVHPDTWRDRTRTGGMSIRAAYPEPRELIADLTGAYTGRARDGAVIFSLTDERECARTRLDHPHPRVSREGTAAHTAERAPAPATPAPTTDEDGYWHPARVNEYTRRSARSAPPVTVDVAPTHAEDAATAREACRVRHQCPTPDLAATGRAMTRRGYWRAATVTADGQRMYWRTEPRSASQVAAALRRSAIGASMRPGAREHGSHYTPGKLTPAK